MAILHMSVRKTNTFSLASHNSATAQQPPSLSLYTDTTAAGYHLDPSSAGASSRGSSVSPIDGHKPQTVVVHKPTSGAYDDAAEPSTADAWKVGTRK